MIKTLSSKIIMSYDKSVQIYSMYNSILFQEKHGKEKLWKGYFVLKNVIRQHMVYFPWVLFEQCLSGCTLI